ncbi:MAG: hypothetical protein GTO14_03785 [Anaerolineales bacterium]|nr:hypothetical protein [Anaerolineales bacterium]
MSVSIYDAMLGESFCYAYHGSMLVDEGVNCETCHGTVISNVSIEETHDQKFTPGMEKLREPDFCAPCHQLESLSGDLLMTVYSEWQESESEDDVNHATWQDCHMGPRGNVRAYHEFDEVARNVNIYRDDLSIEDIKFDFLEFSFTFRNLVSGHAIPASGLPKVMALEIFFRDKQGTEVYNLYQTFGKKFELMPIWGLMPYSLLGNTQRQSGEAWISGFTLPDSLEGLINKVVLTLGYYEISAEHQGDNTKAHWISDPVLEEELIP